MNTPADLKYTASHEWVKTESDGTLTVGITDHAQESLGDIVFLELPEQGKKYAAGDTAAVIESVKAASDIYAPIAGLVIESNQAAIDAPEVAAIVVICAGRTFIAGADISELGGPPRGANLFDVQAMIEDSPKPVIAAIHGTALGAGSRWRCARTTGSPCPARNAGCPRSTSVCSRAPAARSGCRASWAWRRRWRW